MPRKIEARVLGIVVLAAGVVACSTSKDLFKSTSSVRVQIQDGGLSYASLTSATPQIMQWTVDSARVDLASGSSTTAKIGSFDAIGNSPCRYTDNIQIITDLSTQCGGTALAVAVDQRVTATVHMSISHLEVRRAWHPDLPASGDYDGDGVPNGSDNCPLIANPDQKDSDSDGAGDACSIVDPLTNIPTYQDNDGDGVQDLFDNCVAKANPLQTDSDSDGIGDDCEQTAAVILPGGHLELSFSLTFPTGSGRLDTLLADFNNTKTLTCEPSFTTCILDVQGIQFKEY